jgi:hypothetical protein
LRVSGPAIESAVWTQDGLWQPIFHTAPLGPVELAMLLPFPLVVWAADELRRAALRRRDVRA